MDEETIEVAEGETVKETGIEVEGGAQIALVGTPEEIAASEATLEALAEDPEEPLEEA